MKLDNDALTSLLHCYYYLSIFCSKFKYLCLLLLSCDTLPLIEWSSEACKSPPPFQTPRCKKNIQQVILNQPNPLISLSYFWSFTNFIIRWRIPQLLGTCSLYISPKRFCGFIKTHPHKSPFALPLPKKNTSWPCQRVPRHHKIQPPTERLGHLQRNQRGWWRWDDSPTSGASPIFSPHGLDIFTPQQSETAMMGFVDSWFWSQNFSFPRGFLLKKKRVQNQKNWLVFSFGSCSILFSLWKATSGPSSSPVPRSKTLTWRKVA